MAFPLAALDTLIAYFQSIISGTNTVPIKDVVQAALTLLQWATTLWFTVGAAPQVGAALKLSNESGILSGLNDLKAQHTTGRMNAAWTPPSWLIPILIELLKKLLGVP